MLQLLSLIWQSPSHNCFNFSMLLGTGFTPEEIALRLRGRAVVDSATALAELRFERRIEDVAIELGGGRQRSTQERVDPAAFEETKGWLEEYVLALDSAGVQNFLRFITGLATVKATSASIEDSSIIVDIYKDPQGCFPTASTCSRTLYLPAYAMRDEFERKLSEALQQFRAESETVGGAAMRYE